MVRRRWQVGAVGATLTAMLALTLAGCQKQPSAAAPKAQAGSPAPQKMVPHAASAGALAALEGTLEEVYTSLNGSVVNIQVQQKAVQPDVDMPDLAPFGRGGRPRSMPRSGSGSGFVWDKQGHIVTNNHVVAEADRISVNFSDGTTVSAKVVGTDPDSDLAVVQVSLAPERLAPVTLADSTQSKVGQLAIAIGNPFGLEGTMTVGFISALGRLLPTQMAANEPSYTIPDVLQTDAPINPGNSGGVLADSSGHIIGVTSAIISPAGANAGIGFAIPSAVVSKVVPVLITKGRYEHPYLGVVGLTLNPDMAKAMQLKPDQRGALVQEVVPNSPSDKAGIRGSDRTTEVDGERVKVGGDVITALGEKPVKSFDDVVTELARTGEVGKTVTLTLLRGGKEQKVQVALSARPTHGEQAAKPRPTAGDVDNGVTLGISGGTLSAPVAKAMGLKDGTKGVLVQDVVNGSPADKAGLQGSFKPLPGDTDTKIGGDVILALDGKPTDSLETLQAALEQVKPGAVSTLSLLRAGGKKEDIKITFEKEAKH